MVFPVDLILVPQGPEYNAVCRGLRSSASPPEVFAIPMGVKSVTNFLDHQQFSGKRVLGMGLAGSLSPQHQVGDVVIYHSCSYLPPQSPLVTKSCPPSNPQLTFKPVKALTSDRLIYSAREKQELGKRYDVTVVDMEGIAIVNHFDSAAIIRVISDDCHGNLPDLNSAINEGGKLESLKMAIAFLRQPLAAMRLITGSLQALKVLEKVTTQINF
jgi:nucleoside phosphorylase